MKQRALTVFFILAVVIPPLVVGGALLKGLVALVIFFIGTELMGLSDSKYAKWIPYLFIALTMITFFSAGKYHAIFYALSFITALTIPVFVEEFKAQDSLLAITYVTFVLVFADSFTNVHAFSPMLVWFVIICNFSSDTFAYLVGVKFGKTKLLERISPKKTVEGSLGGYVAGALIGFLFAFFFIPELSFGYAVLLSLAIPAVSQIGDLAFSSLKRNFNIKDFGNLLPGHGGVLDRIDSMIFSFIFVAIILVGFIL